MSLVTEIGSQLLFLRKLFLTMVQKPLKIHEIFVQIWKITVDSLLTTAMAGFFVGAIMAVQFGLPIREFDALAYLGGLATSGTFREVGPLLIAFMLSGKVGAYTSAELGTMRVTEQIDAVRCLGADPLQEIVLPRFLGIVISSFFLLAAGLMMSVLGGMLMAQAFAGIEPEEYLRHIPRILNPISIVSGLVKCGCFSLLLASICTHKGYFTTGGAKGVGRSVVATAVTTMVGIVAVDWLTSFLGEVVMIAFQGYR